MPVEIRVAAPADREAILALVPRLRAFGPAPLRPPEAMDAAEREALAAALDAPRDDATLLVAAAAGLPVAGFALAHEAADYFTRETHGHLAIFAVAADAEGRGVGRALLGAVEAWSAARGHRFLTLNVFAANARARAVYERAGYAPDTVRYLKLLA
ncbi:GNAT family N-acetyltransferase [Roseisolibacter sp. H3M3-2]|uniref:GNAT family N-acetyltransferase n=1 Tax=Roseisolibacter sp. H3M3-2 TaxID=3031323 RepID=UPI0023DB2AC2|nr:GNAT family N-acetyltransferase [Roseisolibacter sp. H3M3-2]MDF1503858.1 GNAT family N-acetyltransferase [Roseisolibacter sp. H3M3-2]